MFGGSDPERAPVPASQRASWTYDIKLAPGRFAERLAEVPHLAADWARAAAVEGDAAAQVRWGQMLLAGHGVARDPAAALLWFRLAGRSGNADAANLLGRCHELGWGAAIDMRAAAHWYEIAARSGHAWAQFNLASLLLKSESGTGNLDRALSLLARSARAGNAKAMNMLGRAREGGWKTPPNLPLARRWYLRAARGGCFRGQFHTARFLLADGRIPEAVDWLGKSVAGAPADFCRDVGRLLQDHADQRVRTVAATAVERTAGGVGAADETAPAAAPALRPAMRSAPAVALRLRRVMSYALWRLRSGSRVACKASGA
ncbi:MAG TPA: tetratricopeptide repeat protein [Hyphomicrobiaceae bacterium]|nr:tetratricopeptide repeat protein [Hyphomicrobiaceae bacterium]